MNGGQVTIIKEQSEENLHMENRMEFKIENRTKFKIENRMEFQIIGTGWNLNYTRDGN